MDGTKSMRLNWFILLICLFLCSCKALSSQELSGKYEVKYPYGVETLTLDTDGSFDQEFKYMNKNKVFSHHGKWSFQSNSPIGPQVVFDSFMFTDDFGKPDARIGQVGSSWGTQARKFFGQIQLLINPDLGYFFKKIS